MKTYFYLLVFAVLGCLWLPAQVLKQSTAVTLQIGPFVDPADGNTAVTSAVVGDVTISKAGAAFAALNGSATLTHDAGGWYRLALTTSDTGTLGLLTLKVADTDSMIFGAEYQVIAANAYDGIYGSGDYLQVDAVQVEGSDATDALGTAQTGDAYARLGAPAGASISADIAALPTAAEIRAEMDSNSTQLAAIVADTNELQTDDYPTTLATLATAAALATVDSNVDAILVDTGTTLPGTLSTVVTNTTEPIDANVTQWLGTSAATPNTAGVPIVDMGYVNGNAATDNTAALVDAIWDEPLSGHTTAGTAGDTLSDILADTNELQGDDYPTTLAALNSAIATIDSVVDAILADSNELQTDWVDGGRLDLLLDSASSAGDPWNTALPGSYTSGKAGYILGTYLDVAVSSRAESVSAGAGAYTITTTVTDGTDPLQNATVRVTEGASSYSATTDASGQAAFALDAATYTVGVTKAGYQFTPTTRTVTAEETGTLVNDLAMSAITIPSAPADETLCTVYGYLSDLTGTAAGSITVTFELSTGPAKGNRILTDATVTATSDGTGYLEIDLVRTDAMTPTGRVYLVTCADLGLRRVPLTLTGSTYNLATLIE